MIIIPFWMSLKNNNDSQLQSLILTTKHQTIPQEQLPA